MEILAALGFVALVLGIGWYVFFDRAPHAWEFYCQNLW